MRKKEKGFTLVEVIVTFCLVSTISFLLFQLVLSLKNIYTSSDYKTVLLIEQGNMTRRINDDMFDMTLTSLETCTDEQKTSGSKMCMVFTLHDTVLNEDVTRKLEVLEDKVVYDSYAMNIQKGSTIGDVSAVASYVNDTSVKYNSILTIDIPIKNKLADGDFGIHVTVQYNNITAKVNEEALNEYSKIELMTLTVSDIVQDTVTSGEGLYNVTGEDWYLGDKDLPKFVYRGANPSNLVIFNNKCYRILNITNDYMIKMIYEGEAESNKCTIVDTGGSIGKKVWSSTSDTNNWYAATTTIRNTVLPTWLSDQQANENRISSSANSYVGAVSSTAGSLSLIWEQQMTNNGASSLPEKSVYGDHDYMVTLPMVSDFIQASIDKGCKSITTAVNNTNCGNNNYLAKSYSYWTVNAVSTGATNAWAIGSNKKLVSTVISESVDVRPVIFLRGTTRFSGKGTANDPYIVK